MTDKIDTGRTVSVLAKSYPVYLKDAPGFHRVVFCVELGGDQTLESETFSGLAQLAASFKDERFSLPFVTGYGRKGTITGFHAANGNLLIRWEDGTTSQKRPYDLGKAMPALSDDDYADLVRRINARSDADEALTTFLNEHAFPNGPKGAAEEARRKVAGIE